MTQETETMFTDEVNAPKEVSSEILNTVTNEDGTPKYASVEEGFKALSAAQEHIKTLETENATYRDDLNTRKTTEDLLAEMRSQSSAGTDKSSPESIDYNKVAEVIDQRLIIKSNQDTKLHNQKNVAGILKDSFGDKAETMFNEKAEELGLGIKFFEDMAGKSPQAVLQYFDLKQTTENIPLERGSVNTETIIQPTDKPSAKVPQGGTTKDIKAAWQAAGELVKIDNR